MSFLREFIYHTKEHGLLWAAEVEIKEFLWQIQHVLKFLPILWKDKDFDQAYLLRLIQFKLDLMSKHVAECSMGAEASPTKRSSMRKMRIIMSHIDHYLEIDRYIPYPEMDDVDLLNFSKPAPPEVMRRFKQQTDAEQWHWNEIWTKLNRFGQRMWC